MKYQKSIWHNILANFIANFSMTTELSDSHNIQRRSEEVLALQENGTSAL